VIDSLVTAFRAPDIRRKILFTLGILFIFRVLTNVPVPGVDQARLTELFNSNQLLGLLDLFSGGGLATASIIGMGVNPYINASIIMQLMQGVIPSLGELAREGEYGRNKLNQYTRMLTVPMAFAQGYGFSVLLSSNGVIRPHAVFSGETFALLLSFTAGTILLMWLGELISERGLGNGISFIIFAISLRLFPAQIAQYFTASDIDWVKNVATFMVNNLSRSNPLVYGVLYFVLVVFFTYFYTAFQFRPDQTADYLRKNGGFIPGIRPGKPTEDFLARVTNRITLGGALFLASLAVLPLVVSVIIPGTEALQLGGTSILIVVSVVVETMKQLEAQMLMRHYEGFIR
jgi:preprotein translocase subunit SecY